MYRELIDRSGRIISHGDTVANYNVPPRAGYEIGHSLGTAVFVKDAWMWVSEDGRSTVGIPEHLSQHPQFGIQKIPSMNTPQEMTA